MNGYDDAIRIDDDLINRKAGREQGQQRGEQRKGSISLRDTVSLHMVILILRCTHAAPSLRMDQIFISYASVDRPVARRLADALEARGWSVWWDHRSLHSSQHFDRVIEEAVCGVRPVFDAFDDSHGRLVHRRVFVCPETAALKALDT